MSKKKEETRRYFDPIVEVQQKYPTARYYFILGGRGTGKTFPIIRQAIKDNLDGNGVFVYVRRWAEGICSADMVDLVGVHSEWVNEYTKGQYNKVTYWRNCFYLERWITHEDGTQVREYKNPTPIGKVCDVNTAPRKKGPDFGMDKGGITHIIYDEVLEQAGGYLVNEWKRFLDVVATYVRDRWEKDTKIWLLANPVSKWKNPIFTNLGIKTKWTEKPGITEIRYPDKDGKPGKMSSVFCYIAAITDDKGNVIDVDENRTRLYDEFFAFSNSKGTSNSIVHGFWEMAEAASLPEAYDNDSYTKRTFYFKASEEDFFACDIRKNTKHNKMYLYFYACDEIPENQFYFTLMPELERYAIIGWDTKHKAYKMFYDIWVTNRLFYESNEIADAFHAFCHDAEQYVA